jgi:MoaA/NifB/PqqE/SkfB family radical SAM enzyme
LKLIKDAGLTVKTSCVITRFNVEAFPDYVDAMKQLGADEVGCTILEPTFARSRHIPDPYYVQNRLVDVAQATKAFTEAAKRGACITQDDLTYISFYANGSRIKPGSCASSERNIIVYRDGSVKLCYAKDPVARYVSDGDLTRIWRSQAANRRRQEDAYCDRPCGISVCHRRDSWNS